MRRCIQGIIFLIGLAYASCKEEFHLKLGGDISLHFTLSKPGIDFTATSGNNKLLHGTLGVGKNITDVKCLSDSSCKVGDYTLSITKQTDGAKISWTTTNTKEQFEDCFDFDAGVNWYGGPERGTQVWPIEKMTIAGYSPYVIKKWDNFAVAERYWLNSKGAYIFLNDNVPLYVDQNKKVCFIAKVTGAYVNRPRNFLEYTIVLKGNAKEAHLDAVNRHLGKPKGHPNDRMIEEPIWTTWAKYKQNINDNTILQFANSIRNQGYKNGQLEIDDNWETCYGSQVFSHTTFANIANTVAQLHKNNFRVSLWIHPFINNGCAEANEGLAKGYYVKNTTGSAKTEWWNGKNAYQIDFTNPAAAEWFSARLKALKQHPGIDSFKYDAGETDYSSEPAVYPHAAIEEVPNALSAKYVRNNAQFGDLIEVRSAWRTQDLPVFIRMIDKSSNWGINNGLATLITTLLQMNINGYSFVLPDMIGGNGYGEKPDGELIVRWAQANTFMPSMQFSYLPWEYNATGYNPGQIVKKFVDLHAKYSVEIINAMKNTVATGAPTNPPIWWVDPTDAKALACDDEYMVGEKILVAPVIVKGARSRSVYLPKGQWKDGNNGALHAGPVTLNYNAPIDVLPYFIKQ